MAAGERALIVGAGSGLSAALAGAVLPTEWRSFWRRETRRSLPPWHRRPGPLRSLAMRAGAGDVDRLFAAIDAGGERLDLVVYNASGRARGPIVELDPEAVDAAIRVTAFGGFLVARQAASACCRQGTARSCSPAPAPA